MEKSPAHRRVTETSRNRSVRKHTLVDAQVYGGRNTWRLQLELDNAERGGHWIATRAVASTWR
jgi:ribosomal protein L25 (general stress protein Ctc)